MPATIGKKKAKVKQSHEPVISAFAAITTHMSYFLMTMCGLIRDFFGNFSGISRYSGRFGRSGYAALFRTWENFFTRRMYHRLQDCWNRPLCSSPGVYVDVMERASKDGNCTLFTTGAKHTHCLNLGSYNYLGMADSWREDCRDGVMEAVDKFPLSMQSARQEFGTLTIHEELEEAVAEFVGKEAAMVYSMGYGTNTSTVPALMGPNSLIISDSLNHTSIVNGARGSESKIRVFRHNDPEHLEEILREAIVLGQPRHYRPWTKILVMVEGIYSMEGNICQLPKIVAICKKYKAYLYVDEAHSIGALGKTGRGVCEYHGISPDDIDILMGTFTKSFNGMGGYIAASKEVITFLKSNAGAFLHHNSMSPTVCAQVLTALKVIDGKDGTDTGKKKILALRENSNYFRSEMQRIGLHVYGMVDSPIVPIMLYNPGKVAAFSRECLKRGVAVVVVGFPATTVLLARARFCVSAAHTKEDIDRAVKVIDEVAKLICIRYAVSPFG